MPRFPDVHAQMAFIKETEPGLGLSELELIRAIVHLRRGIDRPLHWKTFRTLLNREKRSLLDALSTRWLVSVADTYADLGSPTERAQAMIIVTLVNVTKMAETERLYLMDARIDEQRRENFTTPGTPLWDGMDSYAISWGDMPLNMWTRIRAIMADSPILSAIFEIVLKRMLACDTVIGRLGALNDNFARRADSIDQHSRADATEPQNRFPTGIIERCASYFTTIRR